MRGALHPPGRFPRARRQFAEVFTCTVGSALTVALRKPRLPPLTSASSAASPVRAFRFGRRQYAPSAPVPRGGLVSLVSAKVCRAPRSLANRLVIRSAINGSKELNSHDCLAAGAFSYERRALPQPSTPFSRRDEDASCSRMRLINGVHKGDLTKFDCRGQVVGDLVVE
jgi:hypothetical protein